LSTAVLKSPNIDFLQHTCLEFYYQIEGQLDSNSLSVSLLDILNKTKLWTRNGNADDTWSHAYINIPSNQSNTKWIEFEGYLYLILILVFSWLV
jgi:hypothetical protein